MNSNSRQQHVQSGPSVYIGPAQQQPMRQAVCWSNASLPQEDAKRGSHEPADGSDPAKSDGSPPAAPHNGLVFTSARLRQSLRSSKRRLIQQILVKLNHAEASDDAEYQAQRERQLALHESILSLTTHVKSFATNLVALGHGSSLIGDASVQIAASMAQSMLPSSNGNSKGTGASLTGPLEFGRSRSGGFMAFDSDFPKNMLKLETHARGLAGIVLTTVVGSLEKKLDAMVALKREMDERENLKLDFDSALRKLRAAKQRGKAEAIVRRDVKLQAARNTLVVATEATTKKFLYYESARPVLVYHELRQFRELQTRFFTLCASSFQTHEHMDLHNDDDDDPTSNNSMSPLSNQFAT